MNLKDKIKQSEENCKLAGNMVSVNVCKNIGEGVEEAVIEFLKILEGEKFNLEEWKKLPKNQRIIDIEEVIEQNDYIDSLIYDYIKIFGEWEK